MSLEVERRCPTCGALVSAEAEWCGQCYASLSAPAEEERARASVPAGANGRSEPGRTVIPVRAREGDPGWPCVVCDHRNPIELAVCAACGTPFGKGYEEPEPAPDIAPRSALVWSLLFPGMGQWRCGKGFDGAARAVLFVWTLGAAIVLLLSRSGKGGLGGVAILVWLFALAALVVYLLSALDAHRLASGDPALVSSRMLLWGSVGLVLVSAVLATLVTINAVRGR